MSRLSRFGVPTLAVALLVGSTAERAWGSNQKARLTPGAPLALRIASRPGVHPAIARPVLEALRRLGKYPKTSQTSRNGEPIATVCGTDAKGNLLSADIALS